MLPETVLASTSARTSEGRVRRKVPFTAESSSGDDGRRLMLASSSPLTVSRSVRPPRLWAWRRPFTHEARTAPATSWISSDPLTSLISSRRARRGTTRVYSTLAGLSWRSFQKVLSWPGYSVRMERESGCELMSIFASSRRSLLQARLTASTLNLVAVPTRDMHRAVDVFEINAALRGKRIDLVKLLSQFALMVRCVPCGCEEKKDRYGA